MRLWTQREPLYLPMGSEATRDYQRRWVIAMLERRAEVARAEAAALTARLGAERLVADTVIRCLHKLEALVKERRRHQCAPHQTDSAERAADATLAEGWEPKK